MLNHELFGINHTSILLWYHIGECNSLHSKTEICSVVTNSSEVLNKLLINYQLNDGKTIPNNWNIYNFGRWLQIPPNTISYCSDTIIDITATQQFRDVARSESNTVSMTLYPIFHPIEIIVTPIQIKNGEIIYSAAESFDSDGIHQYNNISFSWQCISCVDHNYSSVDQQKFIYGEIFNPQHFQLADNIQQNISLTAEIDIGCKLRRNTIPFQILPKMKEMDSISPPYNHIWLCRDILLCKCQTAIQIPSNNNKNVITIPTDTKAVLSYGRCNNSIVDNGPILDNNIEFLEWSIDKKTLGQNESTFLLFIPQSSIANSLSKTYYFRLRIGLTDTKSTATHSFQIHVNKPPTGGSVIISPFNGTAMLTTFTSSARYWTVLSSSLPLKYSFEMHVYVPQTTRSAVILPFKRVGFTSFSEASTFLPAGNVTIVGMVQDQWGGTTICNQDNEKPCPYALVSDNYGTEIVHASDISQMEQNLKDGLIESAEAIVIIDNVIENQLDDSKSNNINIEKLQFAALNLLDQIINETIVKGESLTAVDVSDGGAIVVPATSNNNVQSQMLGIVSRIMPSSDNTSVAVAKLGAALTTKVLDTVTANGNTNDVFHKSVNIISTIARITNVHKDAGDTADDLINVGGRLTDNICIATSNDNKQQELLSKDGRVELGCSKNLMKLRHLVDAENSEFMREKKTVIASRSLNSKQRIMLDHISPVLDYQDNAVTIGTLGSRLGFLVEKSGLISIAKMSNLPIERVRQFNATQLRVTNWPINPQSHHRRQLQSNKNNEDKLHVSFSNILQSGQKPRNFEVFVKTNGWHGAVLTHIHVHSQILVTIQYSAKIPFDSLISKTQQFAKYGRRSKEDQHIDTIKLSTSYDHTILPKEKNTIPPDYNTIVIDRDIHRIKNLRNMALGIIFIVGLVCGLALMIIAELLTQKFHSHQILKLRIAMFEQFGSLNVDRALLIVNNIPSYDRSGKLSKLKCKNCFRRYAFALCVHMRIVALILSLIPLNRVPIPKCCGGDGIRPLWSRVSRLLLLTRLGAFVRIAQIFGEILSIIAIEALLLRTDDSPHREGWEILWYWVVFPAVIGHLCSLPITQLVPFFVDRLWRFRSQTFDGRNRSITLPLARQKYLFENVPNKEMKIVFESAASSSNAKVEPKTKAIPNHNTKIMTNCNENDDFLIWKAEIRELLFKPMPVNGIRILMSIIWFALLILLSFYSFIDVVYIGILTDKKEIVPWIRETILAIFVSLFVLPLLLVGIGVIISWLNVKWIKRISVLHQKVLYYCQKKSLIKPTDRNDKAGCEDLHALRLVTHTIPKIENDSIEENPDGFKLSRKPSIAWETNTH